MKQFYAILIGLGLGHIFFLLLKLTFMLVSEFILWLITLIPSGKSRRRNKRRKKLGLSPVK